MVQSIKLLLVEDNPVESQLLEAILARLEAPAVEVRTVASLAESLAVLGAESFDAVLLDLSLPDSDGLETFRAIHGASPGLPIVVVTASGDEEQALLAVKEGAQDFLFKDHLESPVLLRAVRYAIERARLQAEFRERAHRLGRHQQLLRTAFGKLAAGDLSIRVGQDYTAEPSDDEGLVETLRHFDSTVEQLQRLGNLRARFLTMIAHDLRSPLNTALMAVAALEDPDSADSRKASYLEIVRRKLQSILQLAEDVMEVSNLHLGEVPLERTEVDLNELLTSCVNDLQLLARARQQTLSIQQPDGPISLSCDRAKVQRVIENLVSNAIKYSVEGDTIEIRVEESTLRFVSVQVRDHGPGIGWQEHERIFEPFYRGRQKGANSEGKGLGLGICRAFVKAHGGHLWALSEPEGGTSFVVALPLPSPANEPDAAGPH